MPQPPEWCLSRKAGIVRCCLKRNADRQAVVSERLPACRQGRFSCFCQLLQKQQKNFVHHHIAQFLFSCCVIIILSASSFVNAKMRLVISQFEGILRIIWSAIPISSTFPVRSKMYMASAHGTIVQSILHYKNWSHSPLYAFRFSDI